MIWRGMTVTHSGRKATVSRNHGCWLAIAYAKNGMPSSGEYFSYGRGQLVAAIEWCELQLRRQRRRRS